MANRPTIKDLAAAAGVGVATVDRVLNNRTNVRAATRERVAEAALAIGYPGAHRIAGIEAKALPRLRLGFVLPKPAQSFYRSFAEILERSVEARTDIRGICVIRSPDATTPEAFAATLETLGRDVDVLAAVAPNHPRLTRVVEALKADGVATFSLLNDFAQGARAGYLGTDNLRVGRIAAWMLTTQIKNPGQLVVFIGGHHWHSHQLRETGFRTYLREHAPNFDLLPTMINLDTRQLTHEATLDLLARTPDLRGIYVAGGGMEGAISALRETRPPGRVALVVNEITPDSRAALSDRYVSLALATPLPTLCRDTVSEMVASVTTDGPLSPHQPVQLDLYTPESV